MNRKTARTLSAGFVAGGLLTAAGIVQPAIAYPPGTGLTVTGSGSSATKPPSVIIDVAQGQPGCSVTVTATAGHVSAKATGVVGPAGTAHFALSMAGASGRAEITARTFNCASIERSSGSVYISMPRVHAPSKVKVEQPFIATATNFLPSTALTFVAKMGTRKVAVSTTTNANGFARAKISLPSKGTWVLVAAQSGKSSSTTVVAR